MISRSHVLSKFADFTRVAAPILYLHKNVMQVGYLPDNMYNMRSSWAKAEWH
jgi:hypothetical protein